MRACVCVCEKERERERERARELMVNGYVHAIAVVIWHKEGAVSICSALTKMESM